MLKLTRRIIAIFTLLLAMVVEIGLFFTPAALATENSTTTQLSSVWSAHHNNANMIDSQTIALLDGFSPNIGRVMGSSLDFFKENLPTTDQLVGDLPKILDDKKKLVQKLLSDTQSNLATSLSQENIAAQLDGLVSETSRYGGSIQKFATKTFSGQFAASEKLIAFVLKNITATKLTAAARESAKYFLSADPDMICNAYQDMKNGVDNSKWGAIQEGAGVSFTILRTIAAASTAGAGNLTGYAGMAAAVSQLGLGGVTTTLASVLGSGATGAAATAVVTSAVGGPLVMAGLLVGGTGATAYGSYKASAFVAEKLGEWAEGACSATY